MKLEGYGMKLCPDCREKPDVIFERDHICALSPYTQATVRMECDICGWRTQWHETVHGCVREWNRALHNDGSMTV